jgi:hypothetical protein
MKLPSGPVSNAFENFLGALDSRGHVARSEAMNGHEAAGAQAVCGTDACLNLVPGKASTAAMIRTAA